MEEYVEEEIPDALAQGGRLDKGGRPDGLGCARRVKLQHLVVLVQHLEVLLYGGGLRRTKECSACAAAGGAACA